MGRLACLLGSAEIFDPFTAATLPEHQDLEGNSRRLGQRSHRSSGTHSAPCESVGRGAAWGTGVILGYAYEMFSGNEWLIVVIVALVLFGGSQIPKLAKNLGQAQNEFKKGLSEAHQGDETTEIEPEPTDKS